MIRIYTITLTKLWFGFIPIYSMTVEKPMTWARAYDLMQIYSAKGFRVKVVEKTVRLVER